MEFGDESIGLSQSIEGGLGDEEWTAEAYQHHLTGSLLSFWAKYPNLKSIWPLGECNDSLSNRDGTQETPIWGERVLLNMPRLPARLESYCHELQPTGFVGQCLYSAPEETGDLALPTQMNSAGNRRFMQFLTGTDAVQKDDDSKLQENNPISELQMPLQNSLSPSSTSDVVEQASDQKDTVHTLVEEEGSHFIKTLAAAPPGEQKDMLRDVLYPIVEAKYPALAQVVTDMLLEIDSSELLYMLECSDSLEAKMEEAAAASRALGSNAPAASRQQPRMAEEQPNTVVPFVESTRLIHAV